MPESEERQHRAYRDFRVNKIFATLWPGEGRAVVKLFLPDHAALLTPLTIVSF
jgi:hypothetical protein